MYINTEKLKNLPMEYRPANYWGWLADISPEESSWQVEEMYKAGLGGYVAHSRGGRLVPYMGKEWLDSVRSIIDTGKKYGMSTIMDDEDGWPSGFGGGKVNGMGEDYHVKWLICEEIEKSDTLSSLNLLGVYDFNGKKIKITYQSDKHYVDNINPKTVDAFIEAGYESYYEKFGDELYGIFSDEPQLARHAVPWSNILPDEFHRRYGYDLMENLHAIFYDINGCEKIRFDFWKLTAELFEMSYAKKIGEWCDEHNIIFTGHTTCEESFAWQMQCSGSMMQFYEWLSLPGMDWLCRVPVSDMAVKQLSSVSEQLGKKRALSEMYGCAGWNIGFDDMKWIGEWHYVLGVNYMLQHLGLYSLLGSRKREYPASLFYQQPWWKDFKMFNDYFARLSMILSESPPVIDILVLHPMSSAWTIYNGSTSGKIYEFELVFKDLISNLLGANYDFHYGDDAIIKRHGKIDGEKFIVGSYSYKTVIIPPMNNIDSNTLNMLVKFAENGGIILNVNEFPQFIDGRKNPENLTKLEKYVVSYNNNQELTDGLEKYISRPVYIKCKDTPQNKKIYSRTQKYENQICYYIVNTDNTNAYLIDIFANSNKNLKKLNLETCEFEDFDNINYNLRPTESILLFETDEKSRKINKSTNIKDTINLNGEWHIKNMTENALVLDMCRYSFDGINFEDEIFILKLQKKLLNEQINRDVIMEFTFDVEELPGSCFLLIEEPDKNKININGEILNINDSDELEWHYDKSFKKIPVEKYIKKGENKITLTRYFYLSEKVYKIKNDPSVHEAESNRVTFETELEAIYLLGDFSVEDINGKYTDGNLNSVFADCEYKINKRKNNININDMTKNGLPFFAGTVYLEREFYLNENANQAILSFNQPGATVLKVFVNGSYVKNLCWEPFEIDICEYLKENQINTVGIELTNSLRNLLGPHHNKSGEIIAAGPFSFGVDEYSWNKVKNIVRFGAGDVKIYIK
jgi:hypothetical protein